MKWKSILGFLSITLFLISVLEGYSTPTSQTHKLDTNTYHFKLDNNCRIKFSQNWIYLGDSQGLWTWIGNDSVKFYNLKMGSSDCPNPITIKLSGPANVTVKKLFADDWASFDLSASAGVTSSLTLYPIDAPTLVRLNDVETGKWTYKEATETFTITSTHSSIVNVKLYYGSPQEPPGPGPAPTPEPEPEPKPEPELEPTPKPEAFVLPLPIPVLFLIGVVVIGAIVWYAKSRMPSEPRVSWQRKIEREAPRVPAWVVLLLAVMVIAFWYLVLTGRI